MKKEPFVKILEIMELPHIAKIINKATETYLGFGTNLKSESELSIGSSKVGGNPDLPPSIQWPACNGNQLDFLLQLNLDEIPQNLQNDLLPDSGWLYFFYDQKSRVWGFDPQDKGSWRVLFFQGYKASLVRTRKPGAFGQATYSPCSVEFYEALGSDWYLARDHPEMKNHAEELSKFDNLIDLMPKVSSHKIMGDPHGIQSSAEDMRKKCQFVSHGLYMGGSGAPPFDKAKAEKLAPGAREWRLLLQLDSDSHPHMLWGDRGRQYFWIREQDLKEKNFKDVWMILECF